MCENRTYGRIDNVLTTLHKVSNERTECAHLRRVENVDITKTIQLGLSVSVMIMLQF